MSEFTDPNLASVQIELQPDGDGMTNAATLLVSADELHADESGEFPGQRFATVSITRAELLDLMQLLEDDWQDHCRLADPMADDAPLLTTQPGAASTCCSACWTRPPRCWTPSSPRTAPRPTSWARCWATCARLRPRGGGSLDGHAHGH